MKMIYFTKEIVVNDGTEAEPKIRKFFVEQGMSYSDKNLELAKKEAYNGEYTIEDDGQPNPEPSREEKLEARVKALTETNAMLEECIVEMAAVVYA